MEPVREQKGMTSRSKVKLHNHMTSESHCHHPEVKQTLERQNHPKNSGMSNILGQKTQAQFQKYLKTKQGISEIEKRTFSILQTGLISLWQDSLLKNLRCSLLKHSSPWGSLPPTQEVTINHSNHMTDSKAHLLWVTNTLLTWPSPLQPGRGQ